jgi:cold shock CspA family protein
MNTETNLKSEIPAIALSASAPSAPLREEKGTEEKYVRGIVKSWLNGVKFGFVAPDTDYDFDVFVPGNVVPLRNGEAKLHIGEPVEFMFALKQYRTVCTQLRFPGSEAAAPQSEISNLKSEI